MDSSANRTPLSLRGPGGKACANCARVKSKCIARVDGNSCERCHRLDKSCVPSSPPKRRGPKRSDASRPTSTSATLEKKLDDLMSLMRVQQTLANRTRDFPSRIESETDNHSGDGTSPTLTDNTRAGHQSVIYSEELSVEEADIHLQTFQEEMLPFCPYVYIPSGTKSAVLRQQYPFLWSMIIATTCRSTKKRYSLGDQARNTIIQKIVADGVRSIDMLLGVLTYLSWVHLFPMDKPFASMLSHIVVCLINDMGLHMPPPEQISKVRPFLKYKGFGLLPQVRKERTMEDRRALLGAYIATSMTCHAFRSTEGLRWSSYLDECIDHVTQNSTEAQDHVLVAQVKLQLMINELRSMYRGASSVETPAGYLDALRIQLESTAISVSERNNPFEHNSMMMRLYHFTMLMIHETLLSKPPPHNPDVKRFQIYQRIFDSIRCWVELYFSIPLEGLLFLPYNNYNQLYYVMLLIYKITSFKVPAWESVMKEMSVELVPTLDKVIHRFEQAEALASLRAPDGGADEAFLFGVQMFSALRTVWQSDLASESDGGETLAPLEGDATMGMPGTELTPFLVDSPLFPMMPGIFNEFAW